MNKQQVAMLAIIGGSLIFSLKLLAFLVTNSVALLSDALESIINIVASIMMLLSIRIAAIPEDQNHRYGHQKAENISAYTEGFLILIAAFLIIGTSISRLFSPIVLSDIDLGLAISLTATGINAMLSYVLLKEARLTGSIAMEGDSKHLLSDVLSSIGVVIGLFIASITGYYVLDPLLALIVAAIIIRMGIGIVRKASTDLMDQSCPEVEKRIVAIMDGMDGYIEYHDIKTRKNGNNYYAEFHLCVKGETTVRDSHELTDGIEADLRKDFPNIAVNIHVESEEQCCRNAKRPGA
ncbi:MAG TPA: cation diffusion facilitator family transporter [Methanomassiliicoccales archaeon]|nr:cation diffusion facilitator family transporter [Methanomassiliicoccales archaeon]